MEYMKTPLNKFTFKSKKIKTWVENNCEGLVLNLFAGEILLNINEITNDIGKEFNTTYHEEIINLSMYFYFTGK